MVSYSSLVSALSNNVVELVFHRRRPKLGLPENRRMLCTLNYEILRSENGRTILNFREAAGSTTYNPKQKGLVVVWDILKQDWRMVNTESCKILSTIPTSPPETFWDYFNKIILPMSANQKAGFIVA
jgi:hypothetical protein